MPRMAKPDSRSYRRRGEKKRLGNEESLRKRKEMTHSETKTREEKKGGESSQRNAI